MNKLFLCLSLIFLSAFLYGQDCAVTITSITQSGQNPPPTVHIQVDGKVSNRDKCPRVKIELCCKDNPSTCRIQFASVQADNSWSTLFKDFFCPCVADSFVVKVVASCASTDNCQTDEREHTIQCDPNPGGCPVIISVTPNVGQCTADVDGCQKRQVMFVPVITGTCDFFNWNFGDGSNDVSGSGCPGNQGHDYYHYPQINPKLTLFKTNCPAVTFTIIIPSFPPCSSCPPSGQVDLNQVSTSGCNLTGTIISSICEAEYTDFVVYYGHGESVTEDISLLNGYALNHTYPCDGNYTIEVELLNSNGPNCLYSKNIVISGCGACSPDDDDDKDDDSCFLCICGISFWCCLAYILFFLVFMAMIVALFYALCTASTPAWVTFFILLGIGIALILYLIFSCGLSICELLLAIAVASSIDYAIICGTSVLPCTTWLCKKTTLPILGGTQNFVIVLVLLWLLALLFCGGKLG